MVYRFSVGAQIFLLFISLFTAVHCVENITKPDSEDVSGVDIPLTDGGLEDGGFEDEGPADEDASFFDAEMAKSPYLFLVIIDGARYQETFGDPGRAYIPNMDRLSQQGCIHTEFYNTHRTVTKYGVNSICTGTWESFIKDPETEEIYLKDPSVWEYFRKDLNTHANTAFYVLKYISSYSLWKQSFHEEYGPAYWPTSHSSGETDMDVWLELEGVMDTYHPRLSLLYLVDVDHAGHLGLWEGYVTAIQTADQIVGALWEKIQSDLRYQDKTTLMVTNDHGRHDEDHGGIQGHGDDCPGCQHVMFLTVGPTVPQGCVIDTVRTIVDIVPTVGDLMGFVPKYATGDILSELTQSP